MATEMATDQGFEVFVFSDATGSDVPESMIVAPTKRGLVFYDGEQGNIVLSWPWGDVRKVSVASCSKDPDDMEMISITHRSGKLQLELNDAVQLAAVIARSRPSSVSTATGAHPTLRVLGDKGRDEALAHINLQIKQGLQTSSNGSQTGTAEQRRLQELKQTMVATKEAKRQAKKMHRLEEATARANQATKATERARTRGCEIAIFSVFVYLICGCLFFAESEDWTLVECMYFLVITCTTIGFGDYAPSTANTKYLWVSMLFIVIGISIIFQNLGECSDPNTDLYIHLLIPHGDCVWPTLYARNPTASIHLRLDLHAHTPRTTRREERK
jgi:hypothetical protein